MQTARGAHAGHAPPIFFEVAHLCSLDEARLTSFVTSTVHEQWSRPGVGGSGRVSQVVKISQLVDAFVFWGPNVT
jgi:hypothetical protein